MERAVPGAELPRFPALLEARFIDRAQFTEALCESTKWWLQGYPSLRIK